MDKATDYSIDFDVDSYLVSRFTSPGHESYTGDYEHQMRDFAIQKLQEFFQSKSFSSNCSVLDYGSGPVIANVISAARVATEVVLAEYTEKGRSALRLWLDKDPNAFNWSPYMEYVVQKLERGTAHEVAEREKRLRSIVKAVVHCDITQDPPIEKGYRGPYDVVMSLLCISVECKSNEDYLKAISKLANLVKSGGYLLLYLDEPKDSSGIVTYSIGNKTYDSYIVDPSFVQSALEKNNFQEITVESLPTEAYEHMSGTAFYTACKK